MASEREQQLAAHLQATHPISRGSFLGKEHFWALGEEVGIQRRHSGVLFNELCFPVEGNPHVAYSDNLTPLDPATLGLVIRNRHQIGMPDPPFSLGTNYPPKALMARGLRPMAAGEASRLVTATVVQMQGIIDLAQRPETPHSYISAKSLESLSMLTPRLVEFGAA